MTAFGAVAGMVALQAVIDGRYRDALLWLLAAQILDGLDGPIARKIDVEFYADRIDGHILDLVVDYITCVLVPLALLVRLELCLRTLKRSLLAQSSYSLRSGLLAQI